MGQEKGLVLGGGPHLLKELMEGLQNEWLIYMRVSFTSGPHLH